MMHVISGYQINELLYQSERTIVYRAIQDDTAQPVVIKLLNAINLGVEDLLRFKREFSLARKFTSTSIIKVFALETYKDGV